MKQLILLLALMLSLPAYSATYSAGVSKVDMHNRVVDADTKLPIANAKVSLPKFNYTTYTDSNGNFQLEDIDATTILSVEKSGYRPFSLTVSDTSNALMIGIQKSGAMDIVIESDMMHLGDDNYSRASANAHNFKLRSSGPFYSKSFIMKTPTLSAKNYLVIGSIMGVDTQLARSMGQNRIVNTFASPPEVYFNGTKIAEIQLNGDNQKIRLPNNLILPERPNEVTIKTGRNLMQVAYIDYDDIEIANLSILSE